MNVALSTFKLQVAEQGIQAYFANIRHLVGPVSSVDVSKRG